MKNAIKISLIWLNILMFVWAFFYASIYFGSLVKSYYFIEKQNVSEDEIKSINISLSEEELLEFTSDDIEELLTEESEEEVYVFRVQLWNSNIHTRSKDEIRKILLERKQRKWEEMLEERKKQDSQEWSGENYIIIPELKIKTPFFLQKDSEINVEELLRNWPVLLDNNYDYKFSLLDQHLMVAHSSQYVWEKKNISFFRNLVNIDSENHHVLIDSGEYLYQFKIDSTEIVDPSYVSYKNEELFKNESQLVLSTCYPIWSTKERFIVRLNFEKKVKKDVD